MVKGLYIAGTSMIANIKKMDVIGNNLANVNTTGYKKDGIQVESFNARLLSRINGSNIPYEFGAKEVTVSTANDETYAETNNGYFRIDTPNGIHYGKSVVFFKDTDGYLRTIYKNIGGSIDHLKGNLVLGNNGPIYVGEGTYELDEQGNISVDGNVVDQLVSGTLPNTLGTISAGVRGYSVLTDHEQGQLEMTGNSYDMALKGDGFFVVRTETGDYYTRNGAFTIDANNQLVTMEGAYVLGLEGPITIESESFSVNEFGEVIQNGEITDKLQLAAFTNVSDIYKIGTGYFKEKQNMTGEKIAFEGEVVQGYIEQSNADAITEMIQLIEMNRNYESSQKVITTIDEMIGKCVTELGRV